jgi:hypothetical protein
MLWACHVKGMSICYNKQKGLYWTTQNVYQIYPNIFLKVHYMAKEIKGRTPNMDKGV